MKIKFVPIWRYETHTKNNKGQVCRNICRNDMSRVIATIKEWLPCQIQTGGFRTSQFLPATWALNMGFRYPLAIRQSGHFSGEHDGSHYEMSMDVHGIYWAPSLETSRHYGILGHIKRHAQHLSDGFSCQCLATARWSVEQKDRIVTLAAKQPLVLQPKKTIQTGIDRNQHQQQEFKAIANHWRYHRIATQMKQNRLVKSSEFR